MGSKWRRRLGRALAILGSLAVAGLVALHILAERRLAEREEPASPGVASVQQRRTAEGLPFTVDNSPARFRLDIDRGAPATCRLFSSHAAAMAHARDSGWAFLPSVGLLHHKCKRANDALVRALETALQNGWPEDRQIGKRDALRALAARLQNLASNAPPDQRPHFETALVYVASGLAAGGVQIELPSHLTSHVHRTLDTFQSDPLVSRPIGFWSESPSLEQIFRQDRLLAQGLVLDERGLPAAIVLAGVILDDPELRAAFTRIAAFCARLTNPPDSRRLSPSRLTDLARKGQAWNERLAPSAIAASRARLPSGAAPPSFALVAYARSPEEALLQKRQYGFRMSDLVRAIERRELDLVPTADSGWYDYQWHAVETLLLPDRAHEKTKLILSADYRRRLRESFLAAVATDRETHIKTLPVSIIGHMGSQPGRPARVGPEFAVEPLATVYLRLGRAYRFLGTGHGDIETVAPRDPVSGRRPRFGWRHRPPFQPLEARPPVPSPATHSLLASCAIAMPAPPHGRNSTTKKMLAQVPRSAGRAARPYLPHP